MRFQQVFKRWNIISKTTELQNVQINTHPSLPFASTHAIRSNTNLYSSVSFFLYRRGALLYEKDRRLEYHISNTQIFTIEKRPGLISSGQVFSGSSPGFRKRSHSSGIHGTASYWLMKFGVLPYFYKQNKSKCLSLS